VQLTVDLDDDVVALRAEACERLQMSLEEVDNAALRIGLAEMTKAEETDQEK
jgi:hypothetical protein